MFEPGDARPARVCALDRLGELHLIADQHDVLRADTHRDHVGEADLPGFVDEKVVERLIELGSREQPRRSRNELMAAVSRPRS